MHTAPGENDTEKSITRWFDILSVRVSNNVFVSILFFLKGGWPIVRKKEWKYQSICRVTYSLKKKNLPCLTATRFSSQRPYMLTLPLSCKHNTLIYWTCSLKWSSIIDDKYFVCYTSFCIIPQKRKEKNLRSCKNWSYQKACEWDAFPTKSIKYNLFAFRIIRRAWACRVMSWSVYVIIVHTLGRWADSH